MNQYTIRNTHESLKERLFKYIETEYLGRNDALRNSVKEELEEMEVLWQEPFIEANPSYVIQEDGLTRSENIPPSIQAILEKLIENELGVYKTPYHHQVEAVENYYQGKDLLVATGTGSGKTECFMWPMVTKLIKEAAESPETWEKRGIRAIMLYPMNALVSDQMARLRNIIGDQEGNFYNLFKDYTRGERIPQFGMYTGRTPYPGKAKKEKDIKLAETLERDLLNKDSEVKEKLIEMGKYPAKANLDKFVENLKDGRHITTERDAELVTRLEMQRITPDILITNYSMLEYMLMRVEESSFWNNTKEWLESSSDNKLLFIIDEAHMYKGAPGGEVALLIRRLMQRLELESHQIQFILTSASIPENEEAVNKFACELTAHDKNKAPFKIITGKIKEYSDSEKNSIDANILKDFPIDDLQGTDREIAHAIEKFGQLAGFNNEMCDFSDKETIEQWLYKELSTFSPLLKIINLIQGNAMKFSKLAERIFPNASSDIAEEATNVILTIAPLAKNKEGQVLFPTRLHMMFRGLQGLYACSNPGCSEKNTNHTLPFGKIYLNQHGNACKCGGKIYELVNHRRCGSLYFKGYRKANSKTEFLWNKKGTLSKNEYEEIYLYIVTKDSKPTLNKSTNKSTEAIWLNSITGKIENNDIYGEHPTYLRLISDTEGIYGENKSCPNCNTRGMLTDFSTKGNQSFFNLVSEQLKLQSQTIFDPELLENNPNGGRKVLLFSDSRQRAATLAKELTNAADEEALRKAVVKAAALVQESDLEYQSMDNIYIKFLKVVSESDLQFFYGFEEEELRSAVRNYMETVENHDESPPVRRRRSRRPVKSTNKQDTLDKKLKEEFNQESRMYSKYLLSFLSNQFRSLTDLGLCWIEPDEDFMDDFFRSIEDYGRKYEGDSILFDEETVVQLYAAWANQKIVDNLAYNPLTSNDVNSSLATRFSRAIGISEDTFFNQNYKKLLDLLKLTSDEVGLLKETFNKTLDPKRDRNDDHLFIRQDRVTLRYRPHHDWYRCRVCSKVFPFSIEKMCLQCFSEDSTFLMTDDNYEGIAFLREPIIDAVENDDKMAMRRINTEEHTAQLSHKDQMDNMWSTTEEYELLFQNVLIEGKTPVDILSCTTTMEVGIDIGSLTAVGLRNIPPMRENYQQRAGRAGRRSSAISTIVTFVNNGPHDNHYFYNPEKIISGEPRIPDIDVNNEKLIRRHLNVVILSEFLRGYGKDVNSIKIDTFYNEYFSYLDDFLDQLDISEEIYVRLIPYDVEVDWPEVKADLLNSLNKIQLDYYNNPLDYLTENNKAKSILDVLLEEALFPNYSFSRNVIGFTVESQSGKQIKQRPDRPLDIAISEYAPGRKIVIDKETYVSGGVYNHYSKLRSSDRKSPAAAYFNNPSYFKTISVCSNAYCNWNSAHEEDGNLCPFCREGQIEEKNLLIPWGFAPKNGESENELKINEQYSYASTPSYSSDIRDENMQTVKSFENLRYARLKNQNLNILNTGPEHEGFYVCEKCGSAEPVKDNEEGMDHQRRPYKGVNTKCNHEWQHVVIGAEFKTDMILLEIELDNKKTNNRLDGMWLRNASQTLVETIRLAASDLLDIDFNDINGGYRIRVQKDKTFVDIYLFDSLSSGAGYCSMLEQRVPELINTAKLVLECPSECDDACHDCLKHFGNQRIQQYLDRDLGRELIDWLVEGKITEPLDSSKQQELLEPLKILLENTGDDIEMDGSVITYKEKSFNILVQPVMWNRNIYKSKDTIVLSDKLLEEALPKAYDEIISALFRS